MHPRKFSTEQTLPNIHRSSHLTKSHVVTSIRTPSVRCRSFKKVLTPGSLLRSSGWISSTLRNPIKIEKLNTLGNTGSNYLLPAERSRSSIVDTNKVRNSLKQLETPEKRFFENYESKMESVQNCKDITETVSVSKKIENEN